MQPEKQQKQDIYNKKRKKACLLVAFGHKNISGIPPKGDCLQQIYEQIINKKFQSESFPDKWVQNILSDSIIVCVFPHIKEKLF